MLSKDLHDLATNVVIDLGRLLNRPVHDGAAVETGDLGVGGWGGLDSGHLDCVWMCAVCVSCECVMRNEFRERERG